MSPSRTRQPKSWFERNPKKALFSLTSIVLLVLLLGCELLSRVFLPEWAPPRAERANFWVHDAQLGWAHRPNQQGTLYHRDFAISVRINSAGLRDREYALERNQKKRMLVLGDSFGWGFGVDQDEIFSEIIEERNSNWEIINASVSGYGTDQQYLYLDSLGSQYEPDLVLVLFHPNDFANNTSDEEYWYHKPLFTLQDSHFTLTNSPVPKTSLKQHAQRLIHKTYFFRKVYSGSCLVLKTAVAHFTRSSAQSIDSNRSGDKAIDNAPMQVTARLLLELNHLVERMGAQLIIASVPMDTSLREFMKHFAQEHEVAYLPLDDSFAAVTEPVTFPHDAHWNPTGHRRAADAIEAFMRKRGMLD